MYPINLFSHNWLIKKIINSFVKKRVKNFTGLVLDLGCGCRPFEKDILKYAEAYIGVDWSKTLHGFVGDINADLNKILPIADEYADHIVSFEVLEHLSEPDNMLSESYRILKKGGELTLSVPFQWSIHEAPWDYQRYTKFGLRYKLEKFGFIVESIEETSGFWTMWFLKLNYQLLRIVNSEKILRKIFKYAFIPIWYLFQILAIFLDSIWKEPNETAGYFVVARKP